MLPRRVLSLPVCQLPSRSTVQVLIYIVCSVQSCSYSSSSEPDLKETFKKVLPAKRELLKKVKSHADKKLGDVKVENALGGMRYAHQRER